MHFEPESLRFRLTLWMSLSTFAVLSLLLAVAFGYARDFALRRGADDLLARHRITAAGLHGMFAGDWRLAIGCWGAPAARARCRKLLLQRREVPVPRPQLDAFQVRSFEVDFDVPPRSVGSIVGRGVAEAVSSGDLPLDLLAAMQDRGVIAAAERQALPRLITVQDLRGDLHMHTTATDGRADAETMARA